MKRLTAEFGMGSGRDHHFMATYKLCCFRARPDGRSLKTLHGILPAILPAYVGCSGWNKFFIPEGIKISDRTLVPVS